MEPASAASVAGDCCGAAGAGKSTPRMRQLYVRFTGTVLKDTATALGDRDINPQVIAPTLEAALTALDLK